MATMNYPCPRCYSLYDIDELLIHYNSKHSRNLIQEIECSYCVRKYDGIHNYIKHLSKEHSKNASVDHRKIRQSGETLKKSVRNVSQQRLAATSRSNYSDCSVQVSPILLPVSTQTEARNYSIDASSQTISDSIESINLRSYATNVEEKISNLVGKWYSHLQLPRSIICDMIKDVSSLNEDIHQNMIRHIQCSGFCRENFSAMTQVNRSLFSNFKTEYKAMAVFEAKNTYIKPQKKIITFTTATQRKNKSKQLVQNPLSIVSISIKDVLKNFLELPNVLSNILCYIEEMAEDQPILSVFQGSLWRSIQKKFEGKLVLPLVLYIDDFEVNNPLGSHKVIKKITATYFFLQCLPRKYSAMLDNIFLAQLHHSRLSSHISITKLYNEILLQLKDLEENGITVTIDNTLHKIHFALINIIGDNLGLHELVGITTGFTGEWSCRICCSKKSIRAKQTSENQHSLRNRENYAKHLRTLMKAKMNPSSLKIKGTNKKPEVFGVIDRCCFHALKSYHVTVNLYGDIMHDFFEGVCRSVVPKVLYGLIKKHYITLEILNWNIENFEYGSDSNKNVPPPIKLSSLKDSHLILSAAEMKTLVKYLPLLIGTLIPDDCQEWALFICLRKIISIINCSYYTEEMINNVKLLITEHHELLLRIYESPLSWKAHMMLHYPRIMELLGPLKYFSCMRPEGRHQLMKTAARSMRSRVNPAYSLAIKNQQKLSHRFMNKEGFPSRVSYCRETNNTILKEERNFLENFGLLDDDKSVFASNITICSSQYTSGKCVAVGMNQSFYRIKYMIINEETNLVMFLCNKLIANNFNEHLQSFEITESNELSLINQENLLDHTPYDLHCIDGKQLILKDI